MVLCSSVDGLVTLEAGGRSNAKETEAKPIFREEEREQSYRDPIVVILLVER
jgi:hypothetical protein